MPAVIPLLVAGVSAGATVYAANKSSSANTEAAKTQAGAATQGSADQLKAAEEALAFEKQVYNTKQAQVSPYIGYGQGALAALGTGLGIRPVAQPPAPTPPITNGLPQSITNGNWSSSVPAPGQVPPGVFQHLRDGLNTQIAALGSQPQTNTGYSSGQPSSTQGQAAMRAPQVGEQRTIQGQLATWDGRGWKAAPPQQQGAA